LAKIENLEASESEVSQTVDVKKLTGVDLSTRPDLVAAFGQDVINEIVQRTLQGKSVTGKDLRNYSDSYSQSLKFKAFGKSQNNPNMKLTGDMLDLLDVTQIQGNKVTIGWTQSEQNAKAFGHISGMQGHKFLDGKVPKREFFGLNNSETKQIAKEFQKDVKPAVDREKVNAKDVLNFLRASKRERQQVNKPDPRDLLRIVSGAQRNS
jgi:phage gpG-like protein